MRFSSMFRAVLIAVTVSVATIGAAYADSGRISFNVLKAGFVVGGSGGSGTLTFQGRRYGLSIGGLSYGFTFGASQTNFVGTVSNIRRASDVAGVYGAAGVSGRDWPGRGCHRPDQPERCGSDADGTFGRTDRVGGPERSGSDAPLNPVCA